MNLNFEPFPVIATERLVLRQVLIEDKDQLFVLRSDPRVMKYIARPVMKSAEEALVLANNLIDLQKNGGAITWAITLKNDEKLMGTICFWNIAKEHFRAELGYLMHPDLHGKGIMQEALTPVLEYGFNTMNLHSVAAQVDPNNSASIKLLERNGFVREGYFKEDFYFDGKFLDTAVYSLLAPKG